MPRPTPFRILAFVVALMAGLAAPASALAHGWAHTQTGHEHEGREHASTRIGEHHQSPLQFENAEAGDHPHATLASAPAVRLAPLLALVALHVVLPSFTQDDVAGSAPATRTHDCRPGQAHAPPPRLRAPPTHLG